MITCTDVRFGYLRSEPLFTDLSLSIGSGITGLLGVNGAGKSTLLTILSGALRPTAGRVALGDVDLYGKEHRTLLREIAMMPQELKVPPGTRLGDATRFLAWARGVPPREADARARTALAQVGLDDRADHRLSRLSGGMRRRFALAQAIVASPRVLLLDEPTTGLDPQQRVVLRDLITGLDGVESVVLSSHVIEDIEASCDRVIVLHQGAILFHGTLAELRSRDAGGSAEGAFLAMVMRASR